MTAPVVQLEAYDADSPLLAEGARVYAQTWQRDLEDSIDFFSEYADFPDFRGLVARLPDGRVIGVAFGTRAQPEHWWHRAVAEQVGSGHPALQNAWVLVELAVLPGYRNHGLGTRLHDAILAAQPLPRVLLSTPASNFAAVRLYERLGWSVLHPGFPFHPGNAPYMVMMRSLPGRV